jgi:hypothetical protein
MAGHISFSGFLLEIHTAVIATTRIGFKEFSAFGTIETFDQCIRELRAAWTIGRAPIELPSA